MAMTPDEFYKAFVEGNYDDFLSEPDSVRKGINSAVSAFHMADQYYNYYDKNDRSKIANFSSRTEFLKYLSTKTNYFTDIQSIAIAYKHLYTGSNQSHVSVASTGSIELLQFEKENIIVDGFEEHDDGSYIVIYTTKDSQKIKLKKALKEVVDMWFEIINST